MKIKAIRANKNQFVMQPEKVDHPAVKFILPLTRNIKKAHDFKTADNARYAIHNSANPYDFNYSIETIDREEVERKPAIKGDRFQIKKGDALTDSKAFKTLPIIIGFVITMYLITRREPSPPPAPAHAFYVLDRSLDFAE